MLLSSSVGLSICLPVHLPLFHLSVCLFIHLSVCLSIHLLAVFMVNNVPFRQIICLSLCLFIFLSVCLSVSLRLYTCHLNVCLLFRLFVCLSVSPSSIYPSVYCPFVYLSIWLLSVYLYNCMPLSLSFRLLIYMSVCLSVCFYVSVCLSACINTEQLCTSSHTLHCRWEIIPRYLCWFQVCFWQNKDQNLKMEKYKI
jgi:hypothetical protein